VAEEAACRGVVQDLPLRHPSIPRPVTLSSKPGACHESIAIRVRVLELCGLGGDACSTRREGV
jgi:hypothetical protein